jgi:hypothetical protein
MSLTGLIGLWFGNCEVTDVTGGKAEVSGDVPLSNFINISFTGFEPPAAGAPEAAGAEVGRAEGAAGAVGVFC